MAGIGAASIYASIVSFSLLILGLYIFGVARYITNFEDNTCDMTYMFEYPQYVRIALDDDINERYPRFALYAYGEGFVTQKLRKMKFSGIPVLFVPGNAGSHEQARSLASVSLRKSIDDRTSFHFDYFTVSLGKDYSALYGGVLNDETSYVSLCIDKILTLYKEKVDKIVLIGHSMGGIVAKGVLLRRHKSDKRGVSTASILLTLASPHMPIFLPDRTISRYYQEIENSGHLFAEMNTSIVSIGGGKRDTLVGLSQTIDLNAHLNTLTSGMPDVWRSTDHLCILWCKQLILSVVRALFDSVDEKTRPPTIIADSKEKLRALSYHFTSRITGKKLHPYKDVYNFERGGEWIEDIRKQYTWTCSSDLSICDRTNDVFLMIRLDSPSYDSLSVESINLEAKDWIFACSANAIVANSRVCEWGWNLTNKTSLIPDPMHRSRKKFRIDIKNLISRYKLSHIVVKIPSNELRAGKKSLVKIHVDLYRATDRIHHLQDPVSPFLKIFQPSVILSPNPYSSLVTSRGDLNHEIFLADIHDAVSIEIDAIDSKNDEVEKPCAIFELVQRETSQVRAIHLGVKGTAKKERLSMFLSGGDKREGILRVNLGPEYSYRLMIRRGGIIDRIACSVRDRWPMIYPLIICLCLLAIATRIDGSTRKTLITFGITILLGTIYRCIFETIVAIGIIHVFAVTTCCFVVFFGAVAHSIAARFLARIVALPNLWFDWILSGLVDRVPILTTFLLLSLISVTCGSLAILLSVGIFFLKFTRMYDEYVEGLLVSSFRRFNPFKRRNREKKRETSNASTESTKSLGIENILDTLLLFVTWSFAAVPAIPSALVWAKNFRYETRLTTEEPVMLMSWLVLTIWGSIGLVDITPSAVEASKDSTKLRNILCGTILRFISWFILCTANFENSAHYQWMVPPLVALSVSCVALLSLTKPKITTEQNQTAE